MNRRGLPAMAFPVIRAVPVRLLRCSLAALWLLYLFVSAGCAARPEGAADRRVEGPQRVDRAGWDPLYAHGALENTSGDPSFGDWKEEVRNLIGYRFGEDAFWQLDKVLLATAPGADRLVLAEAFTMQYGYSFVLLVGQGDHFWCYSSTSTPFVGTEKSLSPVW